jgi:hypothetical protein
MNGYDVDPTEGTDTSSHVVFEEIYRSDSWTHGSGPGSHAAINLPFINFLEAFIQENRVGEIVDFGCGDWQYMNRVQLGGAKYTGFDVVDHVLQANERRYRKSNICFRRTPDDLSNLPIADMILFKDVLIHLPNTYVIELIRQSRRKYKFILAINNWADDLDAYNCDIPFGGFRPVDLALPPFSLACATVLRYGRVRVPDPRMPGIVSRILRRYAWPGIKHVQLAFGDRK